MICKYNKEKSKWYKKIDWIRLSLTFVLVLAILYFTLDYLGLGKDSLYAFETSLTIAFLIGLELVLIDTLEHKDRIFVVEKDKVSYMEIHNQKDGKYLSDKEYETLIKKTKKVEDVLKNQKKYEGVDIGNIVKVNKISKRMNRVVVKAEVVEKEWKAKGVFTITDLDIIEKKYNKKFIISKEYENFDKLMKTLEKNN